ncbi:MAG: [FeFe] hydrogenase H-cluster maturation GTPase HydF [Marinifilaceae bacterium]|jgi:[FeFe] hydrogenase H-cluster maturation GTPase HydF|nr:[FeFe] hydrogenase H-cluster maturation GTPase HydF [Marinilabiliaceae bacterium JC040]MCT4599674.1 [FeFe] hydrogenase H-cluster maturation GTPase HydF [Marinifilaceae bacterium]
MSTKDNKLHIGIYGKRNMGKSSLINSITGQEIAIVSETPGTTTDPVKKSYEILDFAPAILIDTAGVDDNGDLGKERIKKTLHTISTIDFAILVINNSELTDFDQSIIKELNYRKVPYLVINNKSDICPLKKETIEYVKNELKTEVINYSAINPNQNLLIEKIKELAKNLSHKNTSVIGDLLKEDDIVMLICPIDSEAPVGRMILPQVQLIRDVLDNYCTNIVIQPEQVENFLKTTGIKPRLVITDSQIFKEADKLIPEDIELTSFSTVLARFKGNFNEYIKGTPQIDKLKDGDRVLILEACSHHVSCEDIGRVKLPNWMTKYTKKDLKFEVISGLSEIKRDINEYALIIHCGGCMITRKQLESRLQPAIEAGIPVANYGMMIAYIHGIFKRAVAPFREID